MGFQRDVGDRSIRLDSLVGSVEGDLYLSCLILLGKPIGVSEVFSAQPRLCSFVEALHLLFLVLHHFWSICATTMRGFNNFIQAVSLEIFLYPMPIYLSFSIYFCSDCNL